MTAGTTYYYGARYYNNETTGSIRVLLTAVREPQIQSLTVDDVVCYDTEVSMSSYWDEAAEEWKDYPYYDISPRSITVEMKSGEVYSGSPDSVKNQILLDFNFRVSFYNTNNQSYQNQYTVGNTYTETFYFQGIGVVYSISIQEKPRIPLILDETVTVTCSDSDYAYLRFVPAETKVYRLTLTNSTGDYISCSVKADGQAVKTDANSLDNGMYLDAELLEGTTYEICLNTDNSAGTSINAEMTYASDYFILYELTSAQRIELNEGETAKLGIRVLTDSDIPVEYIWNRYDNASGRLLDTWQEEGLSELETALPGNYRYTIIHGNHLYSYGYSFLVRLAYARLDVTYASSWITIQPGDSCTLSINISSSNQSLNMQWLRNDVEIPNATQSSLEVSRGGEYTLHIWDDYGNIAYPTITVEVEGTPEFTAQAEQQYNYIDQGETAVLHVLTEGETEDLTYEWKREVSNSSGSSMQRIEGADSDTLSVQRNGWYYCTVSDSYGRSVTVSFRVSVYTSWWTYYSSPVYVMYGNPVTLKLNIYGTDGSEVFTFQWYEVVPVSGGSYKTVLLEGETGQQLVIPSVTGKKQYRLSLNEETYGTNNEMAFTVLIDNELSLSTPNSSLYVRPGTDVTFETTVTANDTSQLQYSWYTDPDFSYSFEEIEGANESSFTVENARAAGRYRCTVRDQYDNTSWVYFELHIDNSFVAQAAVPDGKYTVNAGENVTLAVEVSAYDANGISCVWEHGNEVIEGATGLTLTVYNVTEPQNYSCTVSDAYGNSRWISFRITLENHLTLEALNGQTVIYANPGDPLTLTAVAHADDDSELYYYWLRNAGAYGEMHYTGGGEYISNNSPVLHYDSLPGAGEYICYVQDQYGNSARVVFLVYYIDPVSGLAWWQYGNGLFIAGIGTCTQTNLVIPTTIDGKNVAGIDYEAFKDCTQLKSLEIPKSNGYFQIYGEAFAGCTSLKKVVLGENVNFAGGHGGMFEGCTSLEEAILPSSLTYYLADGLFKDCSSLKSMVLPFGLSYLGMIAFENCTALQSVMIPGEVMYIGEGCFSGCSSLTTVYYGGTAEQWDEIAIGDYNEPLLQAYANMNGYCGGICGENVTWSFANGTLTLSGSGATYEYGYGEGSSHPTVPWGTLRDQITKIVVNQGITRLGKELFEYCSQVTEVSLADGLEEIGKDTFLGCNAVTVLTIPYTVRKIEDTFRCSGLTDFVVDSRNEYYSSVDGVLLNKEKTILYVYPDGRTDESYSMPDSLLLVVTRMEYAAFTGVKALHHIEFSDNLESIGESVFYDCSNLEEIILPDSLTSLGANAFAYCSGVSELRLSNGLKTIAECAFAEIGITELDIPSSVETVEWGAFRYSPSLASVTIRSNATQITYASFAGCNALRDVYYYGTEEEANAVFLRFGFDNPNITYHYLGHALEITQQPQNVKVLAGENAVFTVQASGSSISYQWQVQTAADAEWTDVAGASGKTASYEFTAALSQNGYRFRCAVSEAGGTPVYSDAATLTVTVVPGWKQNANGWWYQREDGTYPFNQWEKINGKWYHFDARGYMQTGWLTLGGKTYYLGTSGAMQTGWAKVDNNWYYLNASGVMQTGWLSLSGKTYYLNASGIMTTGWQKVDGSWYYLNASGVMQTGWLTLSGKTYYLNASGKMMTGWQKVDGSWYYMNASGVVQTGWQKISEKWYYFDGTGAMQTGWQKINNVWYFFKASGVMAAKEWYNGYWFNANGSWTYTYKGSWKKNAKGWWFGDTSGWYAKDCTLMINDVSYTFDANGYMQ